MKRIWACLCAALVVTAPSTYGGIVYQPTAGATFTETTGLVFTETTGVTFSETGGVTFSETGGVTFSETGGVLFGNPSGVTFSEAGGSTFTETSGVTFSEAGGPTFTEAGSVILGTPGGVVFTETTGKPSIDLNLLSQLSIPADTGSINVVVTYTSYPTSVDLDRLVALGITGGTLLRTLPMVIVNATKSQVAAISKLPNIRSIYANKNTPILLDQAAKAVHADTAAALAETSGPNGAYSGRGVGVAVLDTGVDATHPDLANGQVALNVEVVSTQGTAAGFVNPTITPHLPNTDLVAGHGTFVSGIIAGSGAASGGRFRGLATGAHIVGVAVGDAVLVHVLEGLDTILTLASSQNIRVVNCSFGVSGPFDPADPVNIATKALHDQGVTVVMATGNHGPAPGSISPYAVAPWVIGVAGTDGPRTVAKFSGRGFFASALYAPAVSAPAVNIVAPRALGTSVVGVSSAETLDSEADPLRYTTASGTSFAAPIVAALVARMLEANSALTPGQIKAIVQKTATNLPKYDRSEVGAGVVNFVAALHQTRNPQIDYGALLHDLYFQDDFTYRKSTTTTLNGVIPGPETADSQTIDVAAGTSNLHITLGWGPHPTTNDLDLYVYDPSGALQASSTSLNVSGLFGSRESVNIREPIAGEWKVKAVAKLPVADPQSYVVAHESYTGLYPRLSTFASPSDQKAMQLLVRSRALGSRTSVSGNETIDRATLARAFVANGQAKFVPAARSFTDLTSDSTRFYPESSSGAKALGGAIFSSGATFDPKATVKRMEFVRAVVRFSGLAGEAERRAGANVNVADASALSTSDRGFVAVAIEHGLIDLQSGKLNPSGGLTSLSLARSLFNAD